jgi:hypothetical protein
MSKVCGIELKGSEPILAVIENGEDRLKFINTEPRKIQKRR